MAINPGLAGTAGRRHNGFTRLWIWYVRRWCVFHRGPLRSRTRKCRTLGHFSLGTRTLRLGPLRLGPLRLVVWSSLRGFASGADFTDFGGSLGARPKSFGTNSSGAFSVKPFALGSFERCARRLCAIRMGASAVTRSLMRTTRRRPLVFVRALVLVRAFLGSTPWARRRSGTAGFATLGVPSNRAPAGMTAGMTTGTTILTTVTALGAALAATMLLMLRHYRYSFWPWPKLLLSR